MTVKSLGLLTNSEGFDTLILPTAQEMGDEVRKSGAVSKSKLGAAE